MTSRGKLVRRSLYMLVYTRPSATPVRAKQLSRLLPQLNAKLKQSLTIQQTARTRFASDLMAVEQ